MHKNKLDVALTFGFFEPFWGGGQVPSSDFQINSETQMDGDQKNTVKKDLGKSKGGISPHRTSPFELEYVDEVFSFEEDVEPWIEEDSIEESDEDNCDGASEETANPDKMLMTSGNRVNSTEKEGNSRSLSPKSEASAKDLQLQEIINRFGPFSSETAILGICEDGLPILIDFTDPKPGSLLIVSDRNEWNTRHLQSFLASVCMLNSAEAVQITGIGPALKSFRDIPFSAHQGLKVGRVPDLESYSLLEETFSLVEKRRVGSLGKNKVHVFVIDQLDLLLDSLDSQSLSFLRWLVKRGPSANVWVVATLSAKSSLDADWKTLWSFGTILAGYMSDEKFVESIADFSYSHVKKLLPGKQTCVKLGDEVIRYRIPLPNEAN